MCMYLVKAAMLKPQLSLYNVMEKRASYLHNENKVADHWTW
jgi:hypothetical protein